MYLLLKMGICPRDNWDLPLLCYFTRGYVVVCRERGSEALEINAVKRTTDKFLGACIS